MKTIMNGGTLRRIDLMENRFTMNVRRHHKPRLLSPVLAFSGMCSVTKQEWKPLEEALSTADFQLEHCNLPGHGADTSVPLSEVHFEDCVTKAILAAKDAAKEYGDKVYFVGHSLGGPVVISAAARCPDLVKGVVVINCAPRKFIFRLGLKYLHKQYIEALFGGATFNLREEEQRLLADGCDIVFGPESGHILKEIAWGLKVPPLGEILPKRSLMIMSSDDRIIPYKVAQQNIRYHNTMSFISDTGGHFCHCHPSSRDLISGQVTNILRIWDRK